MDYYANLSEDVFILHDQGVGIDMSRKQILSVCFSAPLGSALYILGTCRIKGFTAKRSDPIFLPIEYIK